MLLITGANGFIGSALLSEFTKAGFSVKGVSRAQIGSIDRTTDWSEHLAGVDIVIHTAAMVHDLAGRFTESQYLETNALGTEALAKAAVQAGVKHFIFLSSIKVNGEESKEQPFTAEDQPNPQDSYARSKWEAECLLKEVCASSSLQYTILRLPLVYGPGVRANFYTLMKWISYSLPLPLAAIQNKRSLLALSHLATFINLALLEKKVMGKTLVLSDGLDLSTSELIVHLARAMDRPVYLWKVAAPLLEKLARLFNKQDAFLKISGSLAVDASSSFELLGWSPSLLDIEEAFKKTTEYFLARTRK